MDTKKCNDRLFESNKRLSAFRGRYYTARQTILEEINNRPYDSKIRYGLTMALENLDGQLENGKNNQLQA